MRRSSTDFMKRIEIIIFFSPIAVIARSRKQSTWDSGQTDTKLNAKHPAGVRTTRCHVGVDVSSTCTMR